MDMRLCLDPGVDVATPPSVSQILVKNLVFFSPMFFKAKSAKTRGSEILPF